MMNGIHAKIIDIKELPKEYIEPSFESNDEKNNKFLFIKK